MAIRHVLALRHVAHGANNCLLWRSPVGNVKVAGGASAPLPCDGVGTSSGLAAKELSATSTTAPTPQCRRWVGREGALRGPLKGVWD